MRRTSLRLSAFAAALISLSACDDTTVFVGGDPPGAPRDLVVSHQWVLEGFTTSTREPIGHDVVELSWLPPTDWNQEPFRVYGKRASSGDFTLIATVTSCTSQGCVYRDRNVTAGTTYEYYVATVDEASGEETTSEFTEVAVVPAASRPAAPAADSAVALDGAAYVRWRAVGSAANIARYIVYLTRIDGNASYLYHMGETDGTGFLDERAENGHVYGYRVAAVDTLGRVSALSAEATVIPRPDRAAELIYGYTLANPAQSGFRFVTQESSDPIVAGNATNAQWRLERSGSSWRIVPLNGTSVVSAGLTTELVCGPGTDADCAAVRRAPAAGYQTTPIDVSPEFSYVFRVTGSDGQPHYGVIRATILGTDGTGRDLMIFDWAYQTVANEPRLNRISE